MFSYIFLLHYQKAFNFIAIVQQKKLQFQEVRGYHGDHTLGLGEFHVQQDYFLIKMDLTVMDNEYKYNIDIRKSLPQSFCTSGLLCRSLQTKVSMHCFYVSVTKYL